MWAPDVYEGAPTPITAYMAAAVKAAAFAAFLRVWLEAFGHIYTAWHDALWWLAAIDDGRRQPGRAAATNLKRMLAYSSIGHTGFLLVAVAAARRRRPARCCSTCSPTRWRRWARSPSSSRWARSDNPRETHRGLPRPLERAAGAGDRDGGVHARAARLPGLRRHGLLRQVVRAAGRARRRRRRRRASPSCSCSRPRSPRATTCTW